MNCFLKNTTRKVIFSLLIFSKISFSQNIKISGRATDGVAKEPLPFINIYLQGTNIGTTTDINGRYVLETKKMSDTIVASCVGYHTMKTKISSALLQTINFEMERADVNLEEIIILPGENPAHILLRNIIRRKALNNKENLKSYQYETYNKLEIDVDNLSREAITKNRILRPFAFVLDNVDSSNKEEKPFLPMFLTETLSDYYYRKEPKGQREIIKASRISGIKDESISQFLGSMYQDINIYNNWMTVLGKSFVSPISDNGLVYYKYYLMDSATINGHWCYKVNFMPKRKMENTFFGDFWVSDTTFAIKKTSMQMSKEVNINFVERLSVFQEFFPIDAPDLPDTSKPWLLVKDKLIIDFVSTKKVMNLPGKDKNGALTSAGLIGRKTTSYKNIIINNPDIDKQFVQPDEIVVAKGSDQKKEDYWNEVRHDSLSKNEKAVYALVDTIRNLPLFKTYVKIATFIMTGMQEVGKVDLGPYFNVISSNSVEGIRLRMGIYTNDNFSKRLLIKTFAAYGFEDTSATRILGTENIAYGLKYGASIDYIFSKRPWQKMGVAYRKDYNLESEYLDEIGQDNIFSSVFKRKISQKLILKEEKKIYYERDLKRGFSTRLFFSNQLITPSFPFYYIKNEEVLTSITTTEVAANLRFAYKEKYIMLDYDRIPVSGKRPVPQLQYIYGMKNVLNSEFEYHKIFFNIYDYLTINPIGMLYYKLSAGKIIGTLPYLLLENHKGNQTFYYDKYAFNTMTYYEFVSDQYVSLFLTHYFGGLLFNKIPLFRKLKWRELISAKAVLGDLSKANQTFNGSNYFKSLSPVPFVEAGGGIENILKFIRIDAIWRLTHLKPEIPGEKQSDIPKFGIYGSIQLEF